MGFWRLFDISLEAANRIYSWGWRLSVIGAAVTAAGVLLLMWGTRVRDGDFEKQVATLHNRAASSEERSRQLEKSNLTLQKEVEQEHVARLELELKVAPRRLRRQQKEAVVGALTKPNRAPVVVVSRMFDPEGRDFADDLAGALADSSWTQVSRNWNWTRSDIGVFVIVVSGTTLNETVELMAALDAAKIKYEFRTIDGEALHQMSPWFQQGVLYLAVGAKPQ